MNGKLINFYKSQDPIMVLSVGITFLSALIILMTLGVIYSQLPSQLPLFYSEHWGEKQLAGTSQFIVLPAVIVLICLINLIISWHLHPSQYILKKMLAVSTMIVSVLILITALKVIFIFI